MGQMEALIPAWVAPTAREVADCHWLAHHEVEQGGPRSAVSGQVVAVLDWAVRDNPSRDDAGAMMRSAEGAAYDTLVWLLGHRAAPLNLPRRNPDGSLMSEAQLVAEYMADKWDGPEERRAAADYAHHEATRSRRLASLVPH
jgi:hypothetical protein